MRVVVVGAGIVGSCTALALTRAGCEVTVLDMAPAPLGQVVPPAVSSRVAHWLEDAGVAFHGGQPVTAAGERTIVAGATEGEFDVVVVALGARRRTILGLFLTLLIDRMT